MLYYNRVQSISPILYDIDIPYWGSGMLHTALGHCDLDLWPQFLKNRIGNISPTLFEVAISNFACGCVLMLEIIAHSFWVTVTFTFDLS